MFRLPPRVTGRVHPYMFRGHQRAPQMTFHRRVHGMGAVGMGDATDANLQAAGQTLLNDITANGCPSGASANVRTFQAAYQSAVGAIANTPAGGDGFYGEGTQMALQTVLDAAGQGQAAPGSCVGTPGSTGTVVIPGGNGPIAYGANPAGGSLTSGGGSSSSSGSDTALAGPAQASLFASFGTNPWIWAGLAGLAIVAVIVNKDLHKRRSRRGAHRRVRRARPHRRMRRHLRRHARRRRR